MKRYLIGTCAGILASTVTFWGTGLMPPSDRTTTDKSLFGEQKTSAVPSPTAIDAKAHSIKNLDPYQNQLNINQQLQAENTHLKHQLRKMKEEHFLSKERSKYFYNSGQKNDNGSPITLHNDLYKSNALANRANLEEEGFDGNAISTQ